MVALKGTYGVSGVVTKVETLEADPLYLIEHSGSEMWLTLKDIRRFGRPTKTKGRCCLMDCNMNFAF